MKLKFISSAVISVLLTACGGGGGLSSPQTSSAPTPISTPESTSAPESTVYPTSLRDFTSQDEMDSTYCGTDDGKLAFAFAYLKDTYLWADELPDTIEYDDFSDTEALLNQLIVARDRFSYSLPFSEFEAFFVDEVLESTGITFAIDENREYIQIAYVLPNSPAAERGIKRGQYLQTYDSLSAGDIINIFNDVDPTISVFPDWIFGSELLVGIEVSDVPEPAFFETDFSLLTVEEVPQVAVLDSDVIELSDSTKAGYLVIEQFNASLISEMADVFAQFEAAEVSELILDLRYNGGGRADAAAQLASYIVDQQLVGEVYESLIGNDNFTIYNEVLYFSQQAVHLGLDSVTILVSNFSCSASESVINGLAPFIEVNLVGDTTCGKPYGTVPFPMCDETVYLALNVAGYNALGEGDYIDGLVPNCWSDVYSIGGDWGSEADAGLQAALHRVTTGECLQNRPSVSAASQSLPRTTWKPASKILFK